MEKEKLSSALSKIMECNPKCPVCGSSDFHQDELEIQLTSLLDENGNLAIKVGANFMYMKALPLTCKKCGYILLFNLL